MIFSLGSQTLISPMAKSYLFNQTPNWSRQNLNFIYYSCTFNIYDKCNIYTNVNTILLFSIPITFCSSTSLTFLSWYYVSHILWFYVFMHIPETTNERTPSIFFFLCLISLTIKFWSCISFLENRKCRIGKTILTKAILNIRNSGHPIILDFNQYDRTIVIKTTRSYHKNRHADQWI